MALRSALRRYVGPQMMEKRNYSHPHDYLTRPVLLPSPASAPSSASALLQRVHHDHECLSLPGTSISETEQEPSVSGRSYNGLHSLVGAGDSPKLRQGFESHGEDSFLDHRGHGRMFLGPETKLLAFSVMSGSLRALVIRSRKLKGYNGWPQERRICTSSWNSFPRQMERYSGRPADRDPSGRLAERQARFDENFKLLPPVKKLSKGEYRQAFVEKNMRNVALVPKRWKRALPSREVVDAVMYLRRAKGNLDSVNQVLRKRIVRMLKLEMMLVLSELQRLDEWFLASQIFNIVRREIWYKPNVYLYQTMVQTFGKSKQIQESLRMFEELQAEGLQPDGSIKRELLRAYVISGLMSDAIQLYKEIQKAGPLDRAARSILFHGLNDEQKLELAVYEKEQGYDWR